LSDEVGKRAHVLEGGPINIVVDLDIESRCHGSQEADNCHRVELGHGTEKWRLSRPVTTSPLKPEDIIEKRKNLRQVIHG
jgi:hypothetical protein